MQGLSAFQAAELRGVAAKRHHFTGSMGPWMEHLVQDEGMTIAQARETLSGWEAIPFIDPKHGHMATLIKRNREVHFAIYRRFRRKAQVTSRRIAEFLQPLLDKNIFLVTKIDNPEDAKFIEHLGFQELSVAPDGVQCYILNELKYPRVRHASTVQN